MFRCPELQLPVGLSIHWRAQQTGLRPSSFRGMEARLEERPLPLAHLLQAMDRESKRSGSKGSDWKTG